MDIELNVNEGGGPDVVHAANNTLAVWRSLQWLVGRRRLSGSASADRSSAHGHLSLDNSLRNLAFLFSSRLTLLRRLWVRRGVWFIEKSSAWYVSSSRVKMSASHRSRLELNSSLSSEFVVLCNTVWTNSRLY